MQSQLMVGQLQHPSRHTVPVAHHSYSFFLPCTPSSSTMNEPMMPSFQLAFPYPSCHAWTRAQIGPSLHAWLLFPTIGKLKLALFPSPCSSTLHCQFNGHHFLFLHQKTSPMKLATLCSTSPNSFLHASGLLFCTSFSPINACQPSSSQLP